MQLISHTVCAKNGIEICPNLTNRFDDKCIISFSRKLIVAIEPELNSNTMFNTFQTLEHYQLFQSSSFSYLLVLIFIEVIYTKQVFTEKENMNESSVYSAIRHM